MSLWKELPRDLEIEDLLVKELRINPFTARLLVSRNIRTVEKAKEFLGPDLNQLNDPSLLPNIDIAAQRIAQAIQNKEKIFVHGDYDVDGLTSTSIYVKSLKAMEADVIYRVPRRLFGYDIKPLSVRWALDNCVDLIITTDCGIQAAEAAALAKEFGIDFIVSDHHQPGNELPDAFAIVNPWLPDSNYPFKDISGVVVAFKVMQYVTRILFPEFEEEFINTFIDLASCGTISDVMPLVDENRAIVKYGLKALEATENVGLRLLMDSAGNEEGKELTADSIGFAIAPRLNAVGRVGDANDALRLMLTEDEKEAASLVKLSNSLNEHRKEIQNKVVQEALDQIKEFDLDRDLVLVLANQGWNQGIVGIVAGRLCEKFYKPVIVIGINSSNTHGHGSARSIRGFNIYHAIDSCAELLTSYGGHELAAGLGIERKNIDRFRDRINEYANKALIVERLIPEVPFDGIIDPTYFTVEQIRDWQSLAPFGPGNPEPTFISPALSVVEFKKLGKDKSHLKVKLQRGNVEFDGVSWGKGDWTDILKKSQTVDILYSPQINTWNGVSKTQFVIKDIRPHK